MPHPLAAFYRGKRVLVTGHTGFHGGWIVSWLKLLAAKVLGYGLPPATRPNFFDATLLDRGISSIFGDVRDRGALATAFSEFQPEIVIHCAWRSAPANSLTDPVENFAVNTMGAVNVLEETRLTNSVRALVFAMSNVGNENRDLFSPCREELAIGADGVYGASLMAAEFAASGYMRSFFESSKTAVAVARIVHSIGGGDWAEHRLIPDVVRAITAGKTITIHDPEQARQYLHVLESVRACLLLGQNLFEQGKTFAGPWNFAPPENQSITQRELAKNLAECWGEKTEIAVPDGGKVATRPFFLRSEKANAQLGLRTALDLQTAVQLTVDWYRAFYTEPASAWRTTEDQIEKYVKLLV
jgi:CDP-glucose 4,6-dehydratase